MRKLIVKDILENSEAKLLIGDINFEINDCVIDSTKVTNGSCFFGIMGDKVNGSLFYKEALERGAKIVVINKIYDLDLKGYDDRCVVVCKDVLKTLQDLASYKRSLFKGKVIGITGSVGKTSTKNMINQVLSKKYKVLTNIGNQNSQTGLPLTILRLEDHDIMLLEMGLSMPLEMHNLSMIAKPDISVITNIGNSHYGNFNSEDEILMSKLEILDGMNNGVLVLNNDDKLLNNIKLKKDINIITYGINNKSDFNADNIMIDNDISFDINGVDLRMDTSYYYIYNSLVAFILGYLFNIDNNDIKYSLENFKNEHHRLEKIKLANNITLIDDSYNSSLSSVISSLSYVSKIKGRKILVLGDILELGKLSNKVHKEVGEAVKKINPNILITIGKKSKLIGRKNKNEWLKHFKNEVLARKFIKEILKAGDVILIKGSNGINLVNIVEYLKEGLVF